MIKLLHTVLFVGAIISAFFFSQVANGKELKFYHQDADERKDFPETEENNLKDALKDILEFSNAGNIEFHYDDISLEKFNYERDPDKIFRTNSIGIISPLKYLEVAGDFNDPRIIPLFVVQYEGQYAGYYKPIFIVRDDTEIKSLNNLKSYGKTNYKLYLVDKRSTSGYLMPLYHLWRHEIIDYPTIKAAEDKFETVEFVHTHPEVMLKVKENPNAIGATCDTEEIGSTDGEHNVKVLLRYSILPQDLIVISKDLEKHQTTIENFLVEKVNSGVLDTDPLHIQKIHKFDLEYREAYENLKRIKKIFDNEQHPYSLLLALATHIFLVLGACIGARQLEPKYALMSPERAKSFFTAILDSSLIVLCLFVGWKFDKLPLSSLLDVTSFDYKAIILSFLFGIIVSVIPVVGYIQRAAISAVRGCNTFITEFSALEEKKGNKKFKK